jgi:uncharacterized protein (DUF1697 family)
MIRRGMTRYVAFLRAINVGGHVVRMDALRRLIESVGASNVETFIASGNVIFDTSRRNATVLEGLIETRLQQALGFDVVTFLRTIPEVAAVAAHTPFGPSENEPGAILYVGFLKNEPDEQRRRAVAGFRTNSDDFAVREREVYWLRRRTAQSVFAPPPFEKTLGGPMTMRGVKTVRKIAAKYGREYSRPRNS